MIKHRRVSTYSLMKMGNCFRKMRYIGFICGTKQRKKEESNYYILQHTHTHTHTHTDTHTHTHTFLLSYTHAHITNISTRKHMHILSNINTHIHSHTFRFTYLADAYIYTLC